MEVNFIGQAKYFLSFFPVLWEQVREAEDAALHGNFSRPMDITGRRSGGTFSNSTARRAGQLWEAHDLATRLVKVRDWIDTQMPAESRQLLIGIWRYHWLGWRRIGREIGRDALQCQWAAK